MIELDRQRRRSRDFSLYLVFGQIELCSTLMKQDTQKSGSDAAVIAQLRNAGLRPTRQRIALNQFTRAGLLRELVVDAGRSYFDTNTSIHHHFFFEKSGQLVDVPGDSVRFSALPSAPTGCAISGVDIIIRLSDESS